MAEDQAYYNKGFEKLVSDTHSWRSVSNAVPYVIPYLKKTDKLLDVGLGPGSILKDFAKYVAEVVGVEPTQELVDLAASQPDLPPQVTFQFGLAYKLPFKDNTFDIVHALQVVIHLQDPVLALKEMERVCKPGGYVLVKDADLELKVVYPQKYAQLLTESTAKRSENLSTLRTAGRQLKERAILAGYKIKNIEFSSLVWCISSDVDRHQWSERFCSRISKGKDYLLQKDYLDKVISAYREWLEDDRAMLILIHGELIYRKDRALLQG